MNDATEADNISVISADLVNVGQGQTSEESNTKAIIRPSSTKFVLKNDDTAK